MERFKEFIEGKIYIIFTTVVMVTSLIFFIIIKIKINKIININAELNNILNSILSTFGVFIIMVLFFAYIFMYLLRRQVLNFSNRMSEVIEKLIRKDENISFEITKETLLSKLENKLKKLVEIINNDKKEYLKEKDSIKSLIADISHQIKTPIANISMYNDTLIERDLEKDKQVMFLKNMKFQVSKLEWLVEALIKMSRLESNIINLNIKRRLLRDTIASALKGVYLKAEEKNIHLTIDCRDDIKINHDKKWTSEALFNVIENAVKYTEIGGEVKVKVEKWDLFSKVDIIDTGVGINNQEINRIFKRFYRSEENTDVEGVGIGLYLANEIITKQGGYIKVKSIKGKGSTFSIFLRN